MIDGYVQQFRKHRRFMHCHVQSRTHLCLIRSDNVGPRTFRALINHYGGARAALSVLPDLAPRGGGKGAARIPSREDAAREGTGAQALGAAFVALREPEYTPPSA